MSDLPNTDQCERIAATLIVSHQLRQLPTLPPTTRQVVTGTRLQPVWYVDFYRPMPTTPTPRT